MLGQLCRWPLPRMTDPTTPDAPIDDIALEGDVVDVASGTNVAHDLRTRVVREARRETWFVVNEGTDEIASVPLPLRGDASLRRVEVNGEVAEFSAGETELLVRPRRALRPGAGTIVVLHFR
jgi:hypothetical protein